MLNLPKIRQICITNPGIFEQVKPFFVSFLSWNFHISQYMFPCNRVLIRQLHAVPLTIQWISAWFRLQTNLCTIHFRKTLYYFVYLHISICDKLILISFCFREADTSIFSFLFGFQCATFANSEFGITRYSSLILLFRTAHFPLTP